MSQFKEFYDASYKALEIQKDRYNGLSLRGSQLLGVFTFLITAFTYLCKGVFGDLKLKYLCAGEIILIIAACVMLIILTFAWFNVMKSLELQYFTYYTITDDMKKIYENTGYKLDDIYKVLANTNYNALDNNEKSLNNKIQSLELGYTLLMWFVALFVASVFYYVIIKNFKGVV